MRRVRYSEQAEADLNEITEFIIDRSGHTKVAHDFVGRLTAKCLSYARLRSPVGRLRPDIAPDVRSAPFENYTLFLRYSDSTLDVLAILHGRRDAAAVLARRDLDR
jgi:toxin ParE1/3/4